MSLLAPLPKKSSDRKQLRCSQFSSQTSTAMRYARAFGKCPTINWGLRESSEVHGLPDRKYGEATTRNFCASVKEARAEWKRRHPPNLLPDS